MQLINFDDVYELILKARDSDIRGQLTRRRRESERAAERYREAKAKQESYERLLEDRPDNPGLRRWRGQRAREAEEALRDWESANESINRIVSRHNKQIQRTDELIQHVEQVRERATRGAPARELSDHEKRSLAAYQGHYNRRQTQLEAKIQQGVVEGQKLEQAKADLRDDPNNPYKKGLVTRRQNRVNQIDTEINTINEKLGTFRQNISTLVSPGVSSTEGLSRGQRAARTRQINRQVEALAPTPEVTARPKPKVVRRKPEPKPEPAGRQLTRNIGIKSLTGIVAANIESSALDVDEIFAAASGKGRVDHQISSKSLDTTDLESSVMSRARRDARRHDPDNKYGERIDEISNKIADLTASAMEETIRKDKIFIARRIRRQLRSGEIDTIEAMKLIKQWAGLGRSEILSIERKKHELEKQGYGKRHINQEIKRYTEKLKINRSQKIAADQIHRIGSLTQQKVWEEVVEETKQKKQDRVDATVEAVTEGKQVRVLSDEELADEMDETQLKQWVSAGDHRVCPECEKLDGTVIPVLDDWDTDTRHGIVEAPPLHPNCRCVIELVDG